ncbi:MAG: hypothetical protein V1794_02460 [Candidatus Glassbacteria bacterium]
MKSANLLIPLMIISLAVPLWAQNEDVPNDYDGLLVRNDITATMRGGDIEITVTAMDESIICYATKEIRDHLRQLKDQYLADNFNYQPGAKKNPIPFLVNFRALGQEVRYEPHEMVIYNFGQEFKPIDIVPISPNFNDRVAFIRKPPVSAIYLFDKSVDLKSRELSFVYFNSLTFSNWIKVIEKVNEAKTQYEVYRARNAGKD